MTRIYIFLLFFYALMNCSAKEFSWDKPVNCELINSKDDDFAPSWNKYQNLLYYNTILNDYSNFFVANFRDSSFFDNPRIVKGELNKSNNNQSFIAFVNESEAYYSSFRMSKNRPVMNLFKTIYQKNSWSDGIVIDTMISESFCAQPTISPDGTFMIYSASKKGRKDTDLYMVNRNSDGSWSSSIQIDELNSPGNEITPFLLAPDTLFFASDGQDGPGKLDIFYSIRDGNRWRRAVPVDEFNTEFNESDMTILPNGIAVFASDRSAGKGKLDLYFAKKLKNEKLISNIEEIESIVKTQTLIITSQSEYSYKLLPLFNYILSDDLDIYDNNVDTLPNLFTLSGLYQSTISLIANRLKDYPSAVLYLSQFPDELKLQKIFSQKYQIAPERIKFTNISSFKNIVTFSSNEESLFVPFRYGITNLKLFPPVLEAVLDARPKNNVRYWEVKLIIGENEHKIEHNSDILPYYLSLNLEKFPEINNVEFIELEFTINRGLQNENIKRFRINIRHEELTEVDFLTNNGKKYEEYFIPTVDFENVPQEYLDFIYQRLEFAKSVQIEYFDNSNQIYAEQIRKDILNKIKRKIPSNIAKINPDKIFQKLSNVMIRVLIERIN